LDEICSVPPPLHALKIWGAGVNSPRSYGAEFVGFLSFCLFVCPSRYDARHRKPRRFVYALKLGGTGISPPDTFSFRSSFVLVLILVLVLQQAATYSIAAVAGN